jgi:hypothetical protein
MDSVDGSRTLNSSAVDIYFRTAFHRELLGWVGLTLGSLAIAGVFAFLVAVSRVPGIEALSPWIVGVFHKGLVIHVVFSFVVSFLAVFGALSQLAAWELAEGPPRFVALGGIAVAGMVLALPLLFIPALFGDSEATLNNYVPTIIDPLYYAGLAMMAASLVLVVVRLFINIPRRVRWDRLMPLAMIGAGVIFLSALSCVLIAWRLLAGEEPSYSFNEDLFWGGGHVLQLLNTLLLLIAWVRLGDDLTAGRPSSSRALLAATAVLVAAAALAPLLYWLMTPFSPGQRLAFTNLQYILGIPVLLVMAVLVTRLNRALSWQEPALAALALSLVVFSVGGVLGMFVDGYDTRTPAHYHGVIAGVTLSFMGLFYVVFLPLLGHPAPDRRRVLIQLHLFAWGQLAACIGLFLAGGFGAPRKTAGAAQGLGDVGAIIGMGLNGMGALVAIIGGIMFIWIVGSSVLAGNKAKAERHRPMLRT